jgi:hypothetical protein
VIDSFMQSLSIIQRILSEPVISSGLLERSLVVVSPPALPEDLDALEERLPRKLSLFHRQFLLSWDGLDLEVIRFFGVAQQAAGIMSLSRAQSLLPPGHPGWIAVASDPAGFLYAEDEQGAIWSIDHDSEGVIKVAPSLDQFIATYLFGQDAAKFGGDSWHDDLVTHGILPAS